VLEEEGHLPVKVVTITAFLKVVIMTAVLTRSIWRLSAPPVTPPRSEEEGRLPSKVSNS